MAERLSDEPWMKQPGECFDMHGVPIYPGDLLKSYHFTGRRRRKWHLYHVAVMVDGALRMVPTSYLEPSLASGSELPGCLLSDDLANAAEVIHGHGPGDCLDFTDRKRRKPNPPTPRSQDDG